MVGGAPVYGLHPLRAWELGNGGGGGGDIKICNFLILVKLIVTLQNCQGINI